MGSETALNTSIQRGVHFRDLYTKLSPVKAEINYTEFEMNYIPGLPNTIKL